MKTFQHPETKEIRTVADDAAVQIAALEKLGYKEIGPEDIKGEPALSVTYKANDDTKHPGETSAVPHLTTPILPGPTRDPGAPAPKTPGAITREDVEGTPAKDGK